MDDRRLLDGVAPTSAVIDRLERGRQAARQQWLRTQICAHVTPIDMDILYHVSRHAYRRVCLSGGLAKFNYLANLNR